MAEVVAPPVQTASPRSTAQSHPFTCITCAVAFRSSELQRTHMRSDWHRYNLKRRVATLPPLSSEVFAEKVLSAQASSNAAAAKAAFEKFCPPCQKVYYSENAYVNHLGSQRHRSRLALAAAESASTGIESLIASSVLSLPAESGAQTPIAEVPAGNADATSLGHITEALEKTSLSAAEEPSAVAKAAPGERCLFCATAHGSLLENVSHMQRTHGLFIPEQEYLVNLEGLIVYLQSKIQENSECIFCHKLKDSPQAIQAHMRDKGHCMIAFDSEEEMLEVGEFYDFRGTYSDEEDDDDMDEDYEDEEDETEGVKLGSKLGAARTTKVETNPDDEDWESDEEDAQSEDSDATAEAPKLPGFRSARTVFTAGAYQTDEHELHLPSGRLAGHRSLARYYRQNLANYPSPAERAQQALITDGSEDRNNQRALARQERARRAITRAEGGLGMLGVSDAKKNEVRVQEKRDRRIAQARENRYKARLEKQNNNQKHFRDPLLQ